MTNDWLCNCYHLKQDHVTGYFAEDGNFPNLESTRWCIYSETGNCPCDWYTPMTNLEYLEYQYDQQKFMLLRDK